MASKVSEQCLRQEENRYRNYFTGITIIIPDEHYIYAAFRLIIYSNTRRYVYMMHVLVQYSGIHTGILEYIYCNIVC